MTSKRLKLAGSFVFAAIVVVILVAVLCRLSDATTWLTTAFGLSAGWATGILAAPYKSEQTRFKKIGNVVAGFISGYAVSKLDRVFDLWVDPARGPLILEPMFVVRTFSFLTAFLLASTATYVGRKYVSFGPGSELEAAVSTERLQRVDGR